MKHAVLAFALVGLLVGASGCGLMSRLHRGPLVGSCRTAPENCATCRDQGCGQCRGPAYTASGPASGAVTYPYYTTRGPRDFLARDPGTIGPY